MVNNSTLSINASYNDQHLIFECTQRNFLDQVAEKFGIDKRVVELYELQKNGKKQRIVPLQLANLMRIEIQDKRKRNGEQRSINSYMLPNKYESIITKLKDNSTLNGQERKTLVSILQSGDHSASTDSNKRKREDDDSPKPEKIHKKVQVNMPFTNSKDSTTQTDKITLPETPQDVGTSKEDITEKMKKLASKPEENRQLISKLMAKTFDERRLEIKTKLPPVSNIKEKYPGLFDLIEVKNELGRIFYSEKPKEFINNMYKYAPLIIQKCKSDDLLKRTKKSMDKVSTNVQKNYAEVVGSVFILTDLMDEQWRFIHLQDYPSGSDDIYPHIDASCHKFKELFFDGSLYDIKVEGKKLCDASNFLEAILCLVAAFFIFNIDYPETCRRTMIMFEKLYLKANDTEDIDEHTSQMVKLLELEGKALKRK